MRKRPLPDAARSTTAGGAGGTRESEGEAADGVADRQEEKKREGTRERESALSLSLSLSLPLSEKCFVSPVAALVVVAMIIIRKDDTSIKRLSELSSH